MPTELKQFNPTLRERLSAALQGDAKPGSIREHLVHGLMGSSVGDQDEGAIGMTPVGSMMDLASAKTPGKVLSAGIGALPGMGPGAKAASELIEQAGHTVLPAVQQKIAQALSDEAPGMVKAFLNQKGMSPNIVEGVMAHHATLQPSNVAPEVDASVKSGRDYEKNPLPPRTLEDAQQQGATLKPSSVPPEVDASVKGFNLGDEVGDVEKYKADLAADKEHLRNDGMQPDKNAMSLRDHVMQKRNPNAPGRAEQIHQELTAVQNKKGGAPVEKLRGELKGDVDIDNGAKMAAGGDPAKENFIRNAMQDEGGNVPEEIAMTLLDHMTEKLGSTEHALRELDLQNPEDIAKTFSIPEMLAMHYDLNPELMGKAYEMPAGAMRKPPGRPTQ